MISIIILFIMKEAEYHQELNPIVKTINQCLKDEEYISSEFLELEFKHAYLKFCANQADFKAIEIKSMLRPVVLNQLHNHRKIKVNARCQKPYFQNAVANLKSFSQKSGCKIEEKYVLFINWVEERFSFDCQQKQWMRVDKIKYFQRQYDVISQKKLFRIDFSSRQEDRDVDQLVQKLINTAEWYTQGFIRFKHSFIYEIDPFFSIECNTIYESENGPDYKLIEKAYERKDIASTVKQKVKDQQKKGNTKDQLELKITPQGIDYLRKCTLEEMKKVISRAFDQLRDITNQPNEIDLVKMMSNMTIIENSKKQQEKQEREKQQKTQEEPQQFPKVAKYLPQVRGQPLYAFRERQ